MKIEDKIIGNKSPVFFIAEAGVNHNGSIEKAIELVDIAVRSGADAVKFQTFKAEDLNLPNAPKSEYHIETTGNDNKQTWYELLKTQELTFDMHEKIIKHSQKMNLDKAEIIKTFKKIIPEFQHVEKKYNLDQKM